MDIWWSGNFQILGGGHLLACCKLSTIYFLNFEYHCPVFIFSHLQWQLISFVRREAPFIFKTFAKFFPKVLSLIINFFGQTTFFCPCLVLYLRRVKQNRNCLLFCYKYDETENVEELGKFDIAPEPNTDDVTIDIDTENQLPRTDTQLELQTRLKKIQSNKLLNTVYILLFKKTSLFFGTKLKYLLLILFLTYLVFNLTFFSMHLRVEMPMGDLLPAQSYLKKHLDNHLAHFDLGPVVMLNFVRPLKYWELQVQQNMRNFIQECKNLPGMGKMEISWLQDVLKDLYISKSVYGCQDEHSPACFSRSLVNILLLDQNRDDVGLVVNNKSGTVNDLASLMNSEAPFTELNLTIPYSRIFLSLKEFTGTQENVQTMNQLKSLATEKYNFTNQDLIIYSNVFLYLEQLNEIYPTFVAIFVLSFECIFFGSLMLIFDLRTILIIQLVGISYFVSVIANMVQFGISLNIVTMMQLIIIPAFLFEFFYHQAYLFLYTVEDGAQKRRSTSVASVEKKMDKSIQRVKIKRLKFSFEKSSKKSATFFLFIALFGLNFMYFCDTYNFHSLYIILMSISLNLFLHLVVVYPVLIKKTLSGS
ncbi:patched domain-containing [Brachionus plicatilis]|uniref:Patched domain-containing n=1 Tax=Brachionus plicatilis TaxID=10195 RepID=A0A3M7PH13_BRAPC|nr:patched domain-containing [Brachionus plicatilis]